MDDLGKEGERNSNRMIEKNCKNKRPKGFLRVLVKCLFAVCEQPCRSACLCGLSGQLYLLNSKSDFAKNTDWNCKLFFYVTSYRRTNLHWEERAGIISDKNRKLLWACKQEQCGCCNCDSFIRSKGYFLIKRSKSTKGSCLFLTYLGISLNFHCLYICFSCPSKTFLFQSRLTCVAQITEPNCLLSLHLFSPPHIHTHRWTLTSINL